MQAACTTVDGVSSGAALPCPWPLLSARGRCDQPYLYLLVHLDRPVDILCAAPACTDSDATQRETLLGHGLYSAVASTLEGWDGARQLGRVCGIEFCCHRRPQGTRKLGSAKVRRCFSVAMWPIGRRPQGRHNKTFRWHNTTLRVISQMSRPSLCAPVHPEPAALVVSSRSLLLVLGRRMAYRGAQIYK